MKRSVSIATLKDFSIEAIEAFLNSQHTDMHTVSVQFFPETSQVIAIFEYNEPPTGFHNQN